MHTPGEWVVDASQITQKGAVAKVNLRARGERHAFTNIGRLFFTPKNQTPCRKWRHLTLDEAIANAERIVAMHAACDGIETSRLAPGLVAELVAFVGRVASCVDDGDCLHSGDYADARAIIAKLEG